MRIATISVHGCPCIQPGGTDAGGMNVYVDEVSDRLAKRGNTVHVYARAHASMENSAFQRSYELVHIPAGHPSLHKDELPDVLPEFVSSVIEHAERRNLDHDVIASHYWLSGIVGTELSRAWDKPHVTSFHTLASIKKKVWPEQSEPEIRFIREAEIANDADTVVTWTQGESDHIATEFGLAKDKIAIVPPGVDNQMFAPPSTAKNQTKTPSRILYVGRLDALKGVDLLLDAFAIVSASQPDAELQIVGGGSSDEFRRVLSRVSKLRLSNRVKLPGVVEQPELPEIYSSAACIVAPSFHETFGLAVLEAASCGTPAIAADVDGLRSIVVDGETGFLIQERDPQLYAEKIIRVLENADLRNALSESARKRAEALSWDNTAESLLKIYNRIKLTRSIPSVLR